MKKSTVFLLLLLIALLHHGCQKPGCLASAGDMVTQERTLTPFSQLDLTGNINLTLIQDGSEKIIISAPSNILPNIQTYTENGRLYISNETDCRWLRDPDEKINAELHIKDISVIEYGGSGDLVNLDTLRLPALWINSETGAGTVELTLETQNLGAILLKENASMILHGKTDHCETYTNARGILDLSDLKVRTMYMIYSGLADTHIQVSDELDATIRYKGNVYYTGSPLITRSDYFSSGRLVKAP